MSITIRSAPEPYSLRSNETRPTLASSAGSQILETEINKYLDGSIRGRSFLITGHRGSGKTTLAVSTVQNAALDRSDRRPMRVEIHGLTLLPHEEANKKSNEDLTRTELALRQIIFELYRSVYREFFSRIELRSHPEQLSGLKPIPPEAVIEFGRALDQFPEPGGLREFWRRFELLDRGVLFDVPRSNQGYKELFALTRMIEVYQRVAGTFKTAEQGREENADRVQNSEIQSDQKGSAIAAPTVTLLTAAAGGATAGATTGSSEYAALAAIGTAILGALSFKFSSTTTRALTFSNKQTYTKDLTVATLGRELPRLIEVLFDAGLAPIFLIDELDKVDNANERIGELAKDLKQFVSEQSFTCFMADRGYYEYISREAERNPHTISSTYFTFSIYMVYKPEDLHQYLQNEVFGITSATEDERAIIPALRYILLHQTRMHPIDLKRHLTVLSDDEGELVWTPTDIGSRNDLAFDLLIQVALESILKHSDVHDRVERDLAFRRLVYDVLYFPSWQWKQYGGARNLDFSLSLSEDTEFLNYLSERIRDSVSGEEQQACGGKADQQSTNSDLDDNGVKIYSKPRLKQSDQEFLYNLAQRQARLLSDPVALAVSVETLDQNVIERLPLELPRAPLLAETETDIFLWRFEPSANQRLEGPRQRYCAVETLIRIAAQAVRSARHTLDLTESDRELARYIEPALNYVLRGFRHADDMNLSFSLTAERQSEFLAELEQDPGVGIQSKQLTETQQTELRNITRSVADYLSAPDTLRAWVNNQSNLILRRMYLAIDRRYPGIEILRPRLDDGEIYDWRFPRNGSDQESLNAHEVVLSNARFINEIEVHLSHVSEGVIGLTMMQTHGFVDRSTSVSSAIALAQQFLRGDPLNQPETELISRFADSLEQSGEAIAILFSVLKEALALYNVAWSDLRVNHALTTLRWHAPMNTSTATHLESWDEQRRLEHQQNLIPPLIRDNTKAWRRHLEGPWFFGQDQEGKLDSRDQSALLWRNWFNRLLNSEDWSARSFTHHDFVCELVVSGGPISFFRSDSGLMTIGDWSRVLTGALRDIDQTGTGYVPAQFVPLAVKALGLAEHLKLDIPRGLSNLASEHRDIDEIRLCPLLDANPISDQTAVIIFATGESPAWNWNIDEGVPALVISYRDAAELVIERSPFDSVKSVVSKEKLSIDRMFDWQVIAFELTENADETGRGVIEKLQRSDSKNFIYFGTSRSENMPSPFLLEPKNAEHLVTFST